MLEAHTATLGLLYVFTNTRIYLQIQEIVIFSIKIDPITIHITKTQLDMHFYRKPY